MNAILHEYIVVPAWYQLGFDLSKMLIQLRLHRSAWEYLVGLPWTNLEEFTSPDTKNWGYGQVLKRVEEKVGWHTYSIALRNLNTDDSCEREYVSHVRRTLQMVFSQLRFFDGQKDKSEPQQLIVVTGFGTDYGRGAAGIGAIITPILAKWIHENHERVLPDIRNTMIEVAEHLWQDARDPFWICPTYRECNGLGFTVNTGATNCGSGECTLKGGEGYEIHTHNFDCSLDQFILLAGLCHLHDLALQPAQ